MSRPRKFSGKIKPGMGIDGTEGENFTKRSQDPWTQESNYKERPNYTGAYTNNDRVLRVISCPMRTRIKDAPVAAAVPIYGTRSRARVATRATVRCAAGTKTNAREETAAGNSALRRGVDLCWHGRSTSRD